uniref:Radical SAM protein n=1 Tax=Globodera pallida TaxID=36090 RepID=A0A183CQK4_GLOPA
DDTKVRETKRDEKKNERKNDRNATTAPASAKPTESSKKPEVNKKPEAEKNAKPESKKIVKTETIKAKQETAVPKKPEMEKPKLEQYNNHVSVEEDEWSYEYRKAYQVKPPHYLLRHSKKFVDDEGTSASVGCEPNWRCSFCLGLLDDDELLEKIADEAAHQLRREGHEAVNFVLALNVPMSVLLREAVVERLVEPAWSPMSMSPKELLSRQLMAKISKTTGLRPSLNSDLILTVTLENDEFVQADFDFLVLNFSHEFMRAPGE